MKKALLLFLSVIVSALGFAQVRQGVKVLETLSKPKTPVLIGAEMLKGVNQATNTDLLQGIRLTAAQNSSPVGNTGITTSNISYLHTPKIVYLNSPALSIKQTLANMDERFYPGMRNRIVNGEFDEEPSLLLYWAGYADIRGDKDFARLAYYKAKSNSLRPIDIEFFCNETDGLRDKQADLIKFITERNYAFRETGAVPFKVDSITVSEKELLTELAAKHAPGMIPLINIDYRADDSNLLELYRTATDSIVNGASAFAPNVQNHIFTTLLTRMMTAGQYADALSCFSKEPLSTYAENVAFESLKLCDASLMTGDNEKFNYYLQCAAKSDSTMTQAYYDQYYMNCYNYVIANPGDTELADWILEVNETPAKVAYLLSYDILDKYFPEDLSDSFEWNGLEDYTPENLEIIKSVLHIGRYGLKIDEGRTEELTTDNLILTLALLMTVDPGELDNASRTINELVTKAAGNPDSAYDDLRVMLTVSQAYISAHGMEHPKEAAKILKKLSKNIKSMKLNPAAEILYWQYMRSVSEALGNKSRVKEYDVIIGRLQAEIDSREKDLSE